jgi:hypothetical protein
MAWDKSILKTGKRPPKGCQQAAKSVKKHNRLVINQKAYKIMGSVSIKQ